MNATQQSETNSVLITWGVDAPQVAPAVSGYVVVRSDAAIHWKPQNGTQYCASCIEIVEGITIVYVGPDLQHLDTELAYSTTYYYTVFAFNSEFEYSEPSSAKVYTSGPVGGIVGRFKPFTFAAQAFIKENTAAAGDYFGNSVSISNNTLVVAAPYGESSGAVYVYVYENGTWTQQASFNASSTILYTQIDGDTLAVSDTTGVVEMYTRSAGAWAHQATISPEGVTAEDGFGSNFALHGDSVAISAKGKEGGVVYVYKQESNVWRQEAIVKPALACARRQGGQTDGMSVSIQDNTLVIGCAGDSTTSSAVINDNSVGAATGFSPDVGAAYVYERSGNGTWQQVAYLKAPNIDANTRFTPGMQFGAAVAIQDRFIAVGAPYEHNNSAVMTTSNYVQNTPGAVYLFAKYGSTWRWIDYLKPALGSGNRFGTALALSKGLLVVGSPSDFSGDTTIRHGTVVSPALSSDSYGAAYVFAQRGEDWLLQAYLKAADAHAYDHFGGSVGVDGGLVAVGADLNDSDATGIISGNAPHTSATRIDSGSVYVFHGSR